MAAFVTSLPLDFALDLAVGFALDFASDSDRSDPRSIRASSLASFVKPPIGEQKPAPRMLAIPMAIRFVPTLEWIVFKRNNSDARMIRCERNLLTKRAPWTVKALWQVPQKPSHRKPFSVSKHFKVRRARLRV